MGHERIGILPKTDQWRALVGRIANLGTSNSVDYRDQVSTIASQTIRNVNRRFRNIHKDPNVLGAFEFLIIMTVSGASEHPDTVLRRYDVDLPPNPSILAIVKAARAHLEVQDQGSHEYRQIAHEAISDTVRDWYQFNLPHQDSLFELPEDAFRVWQRANSGAGFCDLSRRFFANFTERYLQYFLDREASAVLPTFEEREAFSEDITKHVEDVSQHAFETAEITQSFAAGWFNNHVQQDVPTRRRINGFLRIAFNKLRNELIREEAER